MREIKSFLCRILPWRQFKESDYNAPSASKLKRGMVLSARVGKEGLNLRKFARRFSAECQSRDGRAEEVGAEVEGTGECRPLPPIPFGLSAAAIGVPAPVGEPGLGVGCCLLARNL